MLKFPFYVKELGIFVWAYVLDCECSVLPLGMLCDNEGFTYLWVANCPPTLTKEGFTVTCYPSHNVPVIFPAALLAEGDVTEGENGAGYTEITRNKTKKNSLKTVAPAAAEGDLADLLADAPKRRSRP